MLATRVRPLLAFAAAGLSACASSDSVPALFLPDTVSVEWDRAWDGEGDGLTAVVPLEVMAYDSSSGAPLPDVIVTVWSGEPRLVEPVALGRLTWDDPELPGASSWWDARRDAWFLLADRSERVSVVTDADGLARLYLVVDALPEGAQPITAAIDSSEETLVLLPR